MAKQQKFADDQAALSEEFAQYRADVQAFFTVDARLAKAQDRLTKARAAVLAAADDVEAIKVEKDQLAEKLGLSTPKPLSNGSPEGRGGILLKVEGWFREHAADWTGFPMEAQKKIGSGPSVNNSVGKLVEAGLIEKQGAGRGTKYKWASN